MSTAQEPGAPPGGPERADLLRVASRAGHEISDRMLETFRAQGLIPRPRRAGYRGRAPVWRYPPGTDQQLAALLGWRQHTKDPDLLQVLLWLDGFPVPAAAVRDALTRQLHALIAAIELEISRQARNLGLDPADEAARGSAIDALARTMAARRRGSPLPRRSRMRAGDRARAVALMVRLFGLGETIDGTTSDAAAIEQVLGVAPNGRRQAVAGTGPWLTGPAEDLLGAAGIVGLPGLLAAVTSASEAELAAARQTVVALFRHLPLMARMVSVMFGDDNYAGLGGLGQLDQQPGNVIYLVPMVISMFRAGWNENIDAVTSALRQFPDLAAQAAHLLEMPSQAIEANLAGKPAATRQQAQRLIDAAIEGQFETGPAGSS